MTSRFAWRLRYAPGILVAMAGTIPAIPACASPLPPPDVIHEARLFLPNAVYKETVTTRQGAAYRFGRNGYQVLVDAKTHRVDFFVFPRKPYSARTKIDQKTAESRVRAWLRSRDIDLTGWMLLEKRTQSHTDEGYEHSFMFGRMAPGGIRLRTSAINVEMDSNGNLLQYIFQDIPVTVSLKPSFAKEELIQIALSSVRSKSSPDQWRKRVEVTGYGLAVSDRYGDIERQMLRAQVSLRVFPSGPNIDPRNMTITIDAHSGKVIETAVSNGR